MQHIEPPQQQSARLSKAMSRLAISKGSSFFGAINRTLKKVCTPDVETMAVDGTHLFWNPAFVDTLQDNHLTGVLIHEAWHVMDAHHLRQGRRDSRRWNEACDYAINGLILKANFELPADALVNSKYDGMSAEQIYGALETEQQNADQDTTNQSGDQSGKQSSDQSGDDGQSGDQSDTGKGQQSTQAPDTGKCGGVIQPTSADGTPLSDAEITEAKRALQQTVNEAIHASEKRGDMPGSVKKHITESREAQVDWKEKLHSFAKGTIPTDYSWRRPHKRRMRQGIYLPSLECNGTGEIVIGLDTSASVSEKAFEHFAGEVVSIFEETNPSAVHLLYCDTQVHPETYEREDLDDLKIVRKGYGGTSFTPVFDWVNKRIAEGEEPPQCVVYLTDGYGEEPKTSPDYPVLWVCCSHKKMKTGETVRINV